MLHLAKREVTSRQRWTLLGWAWPLARQLAQLAVLVFIFTKVVVIGVDDYPVFIFIGLIAFSWFSAGITEAASSLLAWRHLALAPRFPSETLPLAALAVPLVDVLLAVPVLVVMLIVTGNLGVTALIFPFLLLVQLVLMAGLAWIAAAATAYLRDVPNLVTVGLLMLFYLTPVFYDRSSVPDQFHWILDVNPLASLIDGYRDVLLEGRLPDAGRLAVVLGVSLAAAGGGYAFFGRVKHSLVDEL